MPGKRPAASGYARIAQAEEEEDEQPYSEDEDPFQDPRIGISSHSSEYAPIQPKRRDSMRLPSGSNSPGRPRRRRTNSGVDIKAINARLERWAEEIKERFKRKRVKGKSSAEEQLEIHHSVFQAPESIRPATKEMLEREYDDGAERMSKLEFDDLVESVRTAIELGTHPQLISQGSSGSYFARNTGGKVVGVFKPKDEEPYASKNPKWTKWIHRNLFPFAFGRAMLIPNLSYVSEAAAYVLDCQLRTNLVPYTDVIGLSSKSFHYDWMDRRAYYRKGRPFPEKLGSFQVFLKGYKGATEFFREHPWPDHSTGFADVPSQKRRRKRWDETCRPRLSSSQDDVYDSDDEEEDSGSGSQSRAENAYWTEEIQQSFREELEKLVILDYVMRNTDRGTDNWMIRIDKEKKTASIIKEPPQANGGSDSDDGYHRRNESMSATPASHLKEDKEKGVPKVGAIDNSLSWPWKHPDAWRSYPFGWLFLPVSLIGKPFSEKTRKHFLPLLTSKEWWSETQVKLRKCFEIDADFQERMYARQIAVMKGQAWNVVETLKTPDHGPLELTRRNRVHVWDDLVDIPVAVPLPRASEEMRRRTVAINTEDNKKRNLQINNATPLNISEEEEMDISAALPPPAHDDLLGLTGTSLPNDTNINRFNLSRQSSAQNIHRREVQEVIKQSLSPETSPKELKISPTSMRAAKAMQAAQAGIRPAASRTRTAAHHHRLSYDLPRPLLHQARTRRFSLTFARRNTTSGNDAFVDDEGDLGFSAAADHESSMRKVIVERLEMVKSKPPVFTWC